MSNINDLPIEIMSKILSLLNKQDNYRCLFVNRYFYSASLLELWKVVQIQSREKFEQCIHGLNSSKLHIGNSIIRFTVEYDMKDKELLTVLPLIPNLEILHLLNGTLLTDKSITQVPSCCKRLKGFKIDDSSISDQSTHCLARCHRLEKLYISRCHNLTSNALHFFINLPIRRLTIKDCSLITASETALDIRSMVLLTDLAIHVDSDRLYEVIGCLTVDDKGIPYLPQLQQVSIHAIMPELIYRHIPIISFLKAHSQIHHLALFNVGVTNEAIKSMDFNLPNLETFCVEESPGLSAESACHILNCCPKLYKLEYTELIPLA